MTSPSTAATVDLDAILKAGNALSFAAQTSGGVAGRDAGLVAAIDDWQRTTASFTPSLAGARSEAALPICIGRETIQILAEKGGHTFQDGRTLIAASNLYQCDPYASPAGAGSEAALREAFSTRAVVLQRSNVVRHGDGELSILFEHLADMQAADRALRAALATPEPRADAPEGWQTETDHIVQEITDGFRADVKRILGDADPVEALISAGEFALNEMCNVVGTRESYSQAIDALDGALQPYRDTPQPPEPIVPDAEREFAMQDMAALNQGNAAKNGVTDPRSLPGYEAGEAAGIERAANTVEHFARVCERDIRWVGNDLAVEIRALSPGSAPLITSGEAEAMVAAEREACRRIVAEHASIANMLWNDNVQPAENMAVRDALWVALEAIDARSRQSDGASRDAE